MLTFLTRLVGVLLALVGLALTVLGGWFATELGTSGTAQFTVRPATSDPIVIRPEVLNRVDADVVVTATPAAGGRVWMALANPSDATAVLGDSRHTRVTGVDVRDWLLTTRSAGSGDAAEGLGVADLWRQQDQGDLPVTLTVEQAEAPETLVVASEGGPLRSLTFAVTDKTWFVEAVVAALVGLFVLVVGVLLAWPRRPTHPSGPDVPPVPPATPDPADTPDPAVAPEPDPEPRDPEEATR
ncbi:hypothetical protein [Oryzobacter terrae]|uniref:hypothetical protein n=1 Tax=Oryzobacter terrae TaxID=1620385 RepID=UPI00366EA347